MRYDVLIVGAGSAGCVLAARLSEDPDRSVLLLEAGPDYPDLDRVPESIRQGNNFFASAYGPDAHTWGFMANATPGRDPFPLPRGKVVGGSGSINGPTFFRGVPQDYDEWAELGNDEWSFMKVLPYFRKSESDLDFGGDDFHGSDGPIPVRRFKRDELSPVASLFWDACLKAGFPESLDHNHPESTGVGPRPLNNLDGVRMSPARTYLNPSRHRLNLTVRGSALVRRVLLDGGRAVGVEVESGGEVFQIEAGEVILSAGAIKSPQLLMLSGAGPGAHLRDHGIEVVHDLPGVGQNLRDHPGVAVIYRTSMELIDTYDPIIQVSIRYTWPNSPFYNDMTITPLLIAGGLLPAAAHLDPAVTHAGFSVSLEKAVGAGELRLVSADPEAQPALDYRYLADAWDRERMRGGVWQCVDMMDAPECREVLLERVTPFEADLDSDDALDRWMLANVGTSHHSSGTCKMGPTSDPMAVVDQYCRVHGIEALRVVDASVMPDVVRANTNATTVMIAERAVEWIG